MLLEGIIELSNGGLVEKLKKKNTEKKNTEKNLLCLKI